MCVGEFLRTCIDIGLRAVEKARSLARFSLETLRKRMPELVPHLRVLVGTMNQSTRLFASKILNSYQQSPEPLQQTLGPLPTKP